MTDRATHAVTSSDLASLEAYVIAAARLRLEMLPFEGDREAHKRGTRILYCIDSNIINLYLSPDEKGPSQTITTKSALVEYDAEHPERELDVGPGYGVIFEADDAAVSSALGLALSRYIFFLLNEEAEDRLPLIVLPGHGEEVRRSYDRVATEAARRSDHDHEQSKTEAKRRREAAKELILAHRTSDIVDESIVDEIFDLLYSSTHTLEKLNRFSALITGGRFGRLANLRARIAESIIKASDNLDPTVVKQAVEAPRTLHEMYEESQYRLAWNDKLKKARPQRNSRHRRTDAIALASLELLNRKLKTSDARLVLITGDAAMHRAAATYYPDGTQSFGQLYLRHPRAFLASHHIVARPEGIALGSADERQDDGGISTSFVVNWIDGLLARFTDSEGPIEIKLSKLLTADKGVLESLFASIEEISHFNEDIASSWGKFGQHLREQHTTTSETARIDIRRLWKEVDFSGIEEAIVNLDKALIKKSQSLWQSFLDASVHAGYGLAIDEAEGIKSRKRNAPPTYYELFHKTNEFVRASIDSPTQYDLRGVLKDALNAIDTEEPFGYAKMLAYATLHAFHGNWYVARLLADRAITIATGIRSGDIPYIVDGESEERTRRRLEIGPKISGREAYYFAAVARRNIARTKVDLLEVYSFLDDAERSLDQETYRAGNEAIKRARFTRERLAVELSSEVFDFFSGSSEQRTFDWKSLISRLAECLAVEDESSDQWLGRNVHRAVLTNMFMVQALGQDRHIEEPYDTAFYSRMYSKFVKLLCEGGSALPGVQTVPIQVIRLYAGARFGDLDKKKRRDSLDQIRVIENALKQNPSDVCVMPYDAQRYRYLLDMTKALLEKR
jgi:hypothetical protein